MALDLEAIKARLAAATKGEAIYIGALSAVRGTTVRIAPAIVRAKDEYEAWEMVLDGAQIEFPQSAGWHSYKVTTGLVTDDWLYLDAAAPADVAALVAEVERLRALLSETRPGRALDL